MSTISETIFEQYATTPENKALEKMQADVCDLTRKVSSFAKDAAEILSNEPVTSTGRKANVSLLTKQIFGVVALITLALNFGLFFVSATLGQMIISNVGISVLHVLVSMCVVSDLAKGKTHFQNRREQIQERIQTVSKYLKELLQDRQQWVNAISEVKWLTENEQIKLQMAKLGVSTQQDKLDFTMSLLAERTTAIEVLEQEQSELTRDHARLAARNRELTEDLQTANQEIESKERDKAQIEQEIAQLKSREKEAKCLFDAATHKSQSQESSLAEKSLAVNELQNQLQSIHQETERMNEKLAETTKRVADNEDQQLQLNQTIAKLTQEVEEKEIAVQANCDKSVELLTLYETLEVEKKDLVASIEAAKQEYEALERHLQAARDESKSLEIQIQKRQQENIELINRTVHMESQSASQVEMLASGEAQLRCIAEKFANREAQLRDVEEKLASSEAQLINIEEVLSSREAALQSIEEMQKTKEAEVHDAQKELAQVECRAANLMQRMGELECLSVAKCFSEQLFFAAEVAASEVQSNEPTEVVTTPEPCAACLQHQLDAESRENAEAMLADLDSRQAVARQALQESLQSAGDARKQVADAEQRVDMLVRKANGLSDQVQERSAELYELKQDLIVTRAEVRELETAKQQLNLAEQELLAVQTQIELNEADLVSLQTRMAELNQEYSDKVNLAHDLDHQLAELQFKLEEVQSEISISNFELERLRTTNAELVLQCALLQENSARTQSEQNNVNHDLTNLQEEMDAARIALQSLTEQRDQQAVDLEDLSDAVDTRRNQLAEIEVELKKLSVRKQALQDFELEIENAQQHLENLREEGRALDSEVKENQVLVVANEKRVHELLQESRTLEVENTVAADRLKSISDEVADAQSVSQQWQSYLNGLQAEMQAISDRKASLEKEVDLLQSQITTGLLRTQDLDESMKAIEKDHQLAQEQFEKEDQRLTVIQTEAEAALSKRDWLVSQQSKAQKVLEKLQGELTETEQLLAHTVLQWEQEQARLIDGQSQRAELELTIYEMQSSLLILQNEYEDKLRARQEIDAEIASRKTIRDDLARLQIDCNETRSCLLQMMEDRKANETVLLEVCKEMDAKRCELNNIQNSLATKRLQLEDLDEGIATKGLESDELVHQLDQSRREIGKLAAFRKSTEATIGELMQQVDSLQEAVSVCHRDVKHAESSRTDMELMIATIEAEIHKLTNDREQLTSETTTANALLELKSLELSAIRLQITKSEQESVAWMHSLRQLEMDSQLASLELEAKRLEIKAAMVEHVCKPDLQAEIQPETQLESPADIPVERQVENTIEIAIVETSLDRVIEEQQTQAPTLAEEEEDVWNSLNELTRLGQSIRVDEVQVELESRAEGPVSVPRTSSSLPPSSKARPDAWASIFSDDR